MTLEYRKGRGGGGTQGSDTYFTAIKVTTTIKVMTSDGYFCVIALSFIAKQKIYICVYIYIYYIYIHYLQVTSNTTKSTGKKINHSEVDTKHWVDGKLLEQKLA